MEGLVLAVWVSLVSAELVGSAEAPGRGCTGGPGPLVPQAVHLVPRSTSHASNLSCFQCFKAQSKNQCHPTKCQEGQQVCVSNEVTIFSRSRIRVLLSKRCALQCPNSNSVFQWNVATYLQGRITRRCCSLPLCNAALGLGALPGGLPLPVALSVARTLWGR
ncbi:lymphocyte antigen 6L-like isoform X2 [Dipodomys merriami]|uniref:lymphocyte antigen 6L-like isoform X2 n=1 Tax=Dipodomys merriami TaxID=94247 RepID=UPI00385588C1